MSADDGLPRGAAEGASAASLEEAYRAFREPLAAFVAKRTGDEAAAADITHGVFARLAGNPAVQSIWDIRQYLYRAARNELAEHYRSENAHLARIERYAADPTAAGAEALSPEQEAIRRDKLARLRTIVDAMPKKRRTVFLMSRYQELTETEIAARLGMTPEAVRQHVSRAMRDCRAEMRRIFDDPPGDERISGKLNGRSARED